MGKRTLKYEAASLHNFVRWTPQMTVVGSFLSRPAALSCMIRRRSALDKLVVPRCFRKQILGRSNQVDWWKLILKDSLFMLEPFGAVEIATRNLSHEQS